MITIKWWWIDGTFDEFTVGTMREAEAMRKQLYMNDLVVNVEIEE